MNSKSKSKKIFANNNKFPVDPLIKRHKSQESYGDANTLTDKSKLIQSKVKENERYNSKKEEANLSQRKDNLTNGTSKNYSNLDFSQINNVNNNAINNEQNKNSSKRIIFINKEDSVRHIDTEDNVNTSQTKNISNISRASNTKSPNLNNNISNFEFHSNPLPVNLEKLSEEEYDNDCDIEEYR